MTNQSIFADLMRHLTIIHPKKALKILTGIAAEDALCFYLHFDYAEFAKLRDRFSGRIKISNLSGLFNQTFQEIKNPFLRLVTEINRTRGSFAWWGGNFASRNTAATPLPHHLTYFFCAKKILSGRRGSNIILIVKSPALADCLEKLGTESGYCVLRREGMTRFKSYRAIRNWLLAGAKIARFFWQALQSRRSAFKQLQPLFPKRPDSKKRVLIRSWVTTGNFDDAGKFRERNFGSLPEWLRSHGFEVWHLPIFFNLSAKIRDIHALLQRQENTFLVPDHNLKFSDYWRVAYEGLQRVALKANNAIIDGHNISPLINEVLKEDISAEQLMLNLCAPLLKRLNEKGYEIDAFYYPFEGNPPEKQFILACRKYYPRSPIIGFQHTTFFPNQLAYHLAPNEEKYHPLPDKIICSGPRYVRLMREAGFPDSILADGPNLRYDAVYKYNGAHARSGSLAHRAVLLPLTFSHNLAYELFDKVRVALQGDQSGNPYKVYIRSHPLLSKPALLAYLHNTGIKNFEFADKGILQDWLPKVDAVVSSGGSITMLEAIAMGIPVIRVIPDSTFFYDPMASVEYPLQPTHSPEEIRKQIQRIEELIGKDQNAFLGIAEETRKDYFTQPTDANLSVFLQ